MENKNNEREADVRDLNGEELQQVAGGLPFFPDFPFVSPLSQASTSDKYCEKCGHITSHQLRPNGGWVCNICGTIRD